MILPIIIWSSIVAIVVMVVRGFSVTMPLVANRRSTTVARQMADGDAWRMRDILTQVLQESRTDAEFKESYRRIVDVPDLFSTPLSWYVLNEILLEYQRAGEVELAPRLCAERYLKDLTRNRARSSPSSTA